MVMSILKTKKVSEPVDPYSAEALRAAGRTRALEIMHHARSGTFYYYSKKQKRRLAPSTIPMLTEALGHMIFTVNSNKYELDQITFKYAIDFSKDIYVHKSADVSTTYAYALAYMDYVEYLHGIDPEEHPMWLKPGTYRLGQLANAYTNEYAKILLEELA